jgi:ParB-like chromosome segregation protein Spo0J
MPTTTPSAWLPSAIVVKPLASLRPSPTNARTHSKAQLKALAESIRRFGFPVPILIAADGTIIAGHGRAEAAALVPLAEVPCIVADHLTDEGRRAYTLADNQLAAMSDWDDAALTAELRALSEIKVDLAGIGLDELLTPKKEKAKIERKCPHCGESIG